MNKDKEELLKLKELFDESSKTIDKIFVCSEKADKAETE